jgi:hypothetical protein
MDVQCTASVLDKSGVLNGLVAVVNPLSAMRAWLGSADEIARIAVREIRADATSALARSSFAAAMFKLAAQESVGGQLGARIVARGEGRPGAVRPAAAAAVRCRLAAQPEEMLSWLVRARVRSLDVDLEGASRGADAR